MPSWRLRNLLNVRLLAGVLCLTGMGMAAGAGPTGQTLQSRTQPDDKNYEFVRMSKPDGTVVEMRVPRHRSLSARPSVATTSSVRRLPGTAAAGEVPEATPRVGGRRAVTLGGQRGATARASSEGPVRSARADAGRRDSGRVVTQRANTGARISHPYTGSRQLTSDVVDLMRPAGIPRGGAVSQTPVVASDNASEWRTGLGWVPLNEDDDTGRYLSEDDAFAELEPGDGWDGPTDDPGPIGNDSMPGWDAQAIARWNVVPYQTITGDFILGIVAFHRCGIDRVAISLEGGDWVDVDRPRFNPRTETYEYGVMIRPALLAGDGPVEIRAIVYPNVGLPRVLAGPLDGSLAFKNGEHSMLLTTNANGTLVVPTFYCSPLGNDTDGDGSATLPFRTPGRALREATAQFGSADGTLCYLLPGNYPWGPKPWPLIVTRDRWPILTPAPGVSRSEVVIDNGPIGGFSTTLIAARNVTITGNQTVRGGVMVWLDNCVAVGPGPEGIRNSSLFNGNTDFLAEYITDCDVSLYRNGVREATLTRNTFVHDIWGVPFGQTGLVVNSRADTINDMGTGSHGDVLRWLLSPEPLENFIAYGVNVTNADVQGVFAETQPDADQLDDVALVNVHISKDADSANGSWWEPDTNHLLIWHCSLPDQPFRWAQGNYNTSLRNVSILGSVFGSFTHTPLPTHDSTLCVVNHIHYVRDDVYGAFYVGDDQSFGDPGFRNPGAGDYSLAQASVLRSRIPLDDNVVFDDLTQVLRRSPTAIGPFATDEGPAR